jgi:hypothetical protein
MPVAARRRVAVLPGRWAWTTLDGRRRSIGHMKALLLLSAVAGCAHDVRVDYARAMPDTGSLEVVLNDASRSLSVTVDGALMVDRRRSRKARIDGIPAGPVSVTVATGGGCEQAMTVDRTVDIVPGAVTTLALPAPEPNTGCMIYSGLYYVGLNVGLVAVVLAASTARPGK